MPNRFKPFAKAGSPRNVQFPSHRKRYEALHPPLQLNTGFMKDTVPNDHRNIDVFNNVETNVLKMGSSNKYKESSFPMLLSWFNALFRVDFHLQFTTVLRSATSILDRKNNVAGKLVVLKKLLDASVCYKPFDELDASAIVINVKQLGRTKIT